MTLDNGLFNFGHNVFRPGLRVSDIPSANSDAVAWLQPHDAGLLLGIQEADVNGFPKLSERDQ